MLAGRGGRVLLSLMTGVASAAGFLTTDIQPQNLGLLRATVPSHLRVGLDGGLGGMDAGLWLLGGGLFVIILTAGGMGARSGLRVDMAS